MPAFAARLHDDRSAGGAGDYRGGAGCIDAGSGQSGDSEVELHQRLLAGWSADNTLAQLKLAHSWPEVGSSSFDCSQGNLQMLCTERVTATPNPVFRRVEVSVTTPGRAGNLAQMVTVVANETNRSL